MTDLLSKERLEHIIKEGAGSSAGYSFREVTLATELLQCREAAEKPVFYVMYDEENDDLEFNSTDEFSCGRRGGKPLYEAPPLTSAEREELQRYRAAVDKPIGEINHDNGSVTWLCDVPAGALVYSLPQLTNSERERLAAYDRAAKEPVALPDYMPRLNDATLDNIIKQDAEGSVANAARMLAVEVKFWHSKPLFTAPQTVVTDESSRILFEPEPTDSANAPLSFSDAQDTAWVVGAEWMRDAFKQANSHLKLAGDGDHYPRLPVVPTFEDWLESTENKPLGWVKEAMKESYDACRAAMLQSGNYPAIPEGYCVMPKKLTADNGAKGALSGEFSESKTISCPECLGDDECETCDGSGTIEINVPVSWTTIKAIWAKGVEHFAATPQPNKETHEPFDDRP